MSEYSGQEECWDELEEKQGFEAAEAKLKKKEPKR